jgi:hypothetical protein
MTLTQKLHAQRIRKTLLNGYPPQGGFVGVLSRISDEELLQLEREAHAEKLAWLETRRAESVLNGIIRRAVQNG